jgi:hypothetical protein
MPATLVLWPLIVNCDSRAAVLRFPVLCDLPALHRLVYPISRRIHLIISSRLVSLLSSPLLLFSPPARCSLPSDLPLTLLRLAFSHSFSPTLLPPCLPPATSLVTPRHLRGFLFSLTSHGLFVMSLAYHCPVSGCSKECKSSRGLMQHVNSFHRQTSPVSCSGELPGPTSVRWTHPTLTGR